MKVFSLRHLDALRSDGKARVVACVRFAAEGHKVRPQHLHTAGWNRPNRAFEIEFGPLGVAQLARARIEQCKQLQAGDNLRAAIVSSNGTEEAAESKRLQVRLRVTDTLLGR